MTFYSIANSGVETLSSDFSIDASYELSLVINQKIQHLPLKFCLKLSPDCIVHPLSERSECVSICVWYTLYVLEYLL